MHLLFLIIIANGAPIVLRALMKSRLNVAIDVGYMLTDNKPLFGKSKTWRGVAAAVIFYLNQRYITG
jgi:CDP-2,3-bis-(O-geranylgeranyl)-sn-glycerol synthase